MLSDTHPIMTSLTDDVIVDGITGINISMVTDSRTVMNYSGTCWTG